MFNFFESYERNARIDTAILFSIPLSLSKITKGDKIYGSFYF